MKRQLLSAAAVALLLALGACKGKKTQRAKMDKSREVDLTSQIANQYDGIRKAYAKDGAKLPKQVQSLYGAMQTMHAQCAGVYGRMNAPSGMGAGHGMSGGMMGRGMMRDNTMARAREWDMELASMSRVMAGMVDRAGEKDLAIRYRKLADLHQQRMKIMPAVPPSAPQAVEKTPTSGKDLYEQNCAFCHQSDGAGIPGTIPPVGESPWVTGDDTIPARILDNGLVGPIEVMGKTYNDGMAGYRARLTPAQIAAILSYVRGALGNVARPLSADEAKAIRAAFAGRSEPWTAKELLGTRAHKAAGGE